MDHLTLYITHITNVSNRNESTHTHTHTRKDEYHNTSFKLSISVYNDTSI